MDLYSTSDLKQTRRFNSEAEYRLWQHKLEISYAPLRRPNLVRALVANVRRVVGRPGQTQPDMIRPVSSTRKTQTMARVTK